MVALKCVFLVLLLCFQYGDSYKVYILPEPGAFCLGVFSGDDCITWSDYSANPKLADHSTTLIFTPGVYRYSQSYRRTLQLSVTNIKRFTMIGDAGAELQFRLSFSNIGQVHVRNLTLSNSPRIDVRNVQSFMMENCTLLPALQTSSSYNSPGMYIYNSKLVQVIESTFNKVKINVQSHSTLFTDRCTFINSSTATFITGDSYSTLILNNSNFLNNYASDNGIVFTRGAVAINNCLFDRNSVRYSSAAVVGSTTGDITITGSNFIRNRASYVSSSSSYRPVRYAYYEGGSAIRGGRNINITNCTFSHYTRSSQIVYSYRYSSYYSSQGSYQVYIVDSTFYSSVRSIYSYNDVTLVNSSFYNATSSGGGGAVYSTRTVTTINCKFVNSTTVNGYGGVIYSQLNQSLLNSVFIGNSANYNTYYNRAYGGALYSQRGGISLTNCYISISIASGDGGAVYTTQNVTITDTTIINSASKSGSGGAIYGLNVEITSSALSNNVANGNGGAIYAVQNITIVDSTFSNNTASTGNGGAICSGNDVTVTNCTISESSAALEGGAIYSGAGESRYIFNPNIVLSKSTFRSNFATSGGVLYTTGHYHHHVRFIDSTFVLNEAVRGGVAHVENSSLSIVECSFNNNEATEDGGVLDMIFSSVSIQDTSLSQNNAGINGGVFYGQNYSTNFTIAHTIIDHNSAVNGGVFYIRRSNSNINILSGSKLISNSAGNQGGAMDIRGVTLTMDMDTVVANNTAGSSGDVISACVSQITAYGLEARLDPVYPQYCLIYDEGNSSIPQPMSQTISTDESTTVFTTEQTLIGTTSHEGDTESVMTTVSERGTTNEEMANMTTFASTSTSAATFTSDSPGVSHTHSPYEATTSPPSDTTSQLPSDNVAATTESNTQIPSVIASTESQPHTDEVVTTSVDVTTPAGVNQETSSSPIASTSQDGHEGSTTMPVELSITTATVTTITLSETDSPTGSMDSSVTTNPDRVAVLQGEQDKYDDAWKSSQHNLLQVSIVSLMVLCMVCTAVCAMMITLFFITCKRRRDPRVVTQARYKPVDKDLEETKHENEYSFSEI